MRRRSCARSASGLPSSSAPRARMPTVAMRCRASFARPKKRCGTRASGSAMSASGSPRATPTSRNSQPIARAMKMRSANSRKRSRPSFARPTWAAARSSSSCSSPRTIPPSSAACSSTTPISAAHAREIAEIQKIFAALEQAVGGEPERERLAVLEAESRQELSSVDAARDERSRALKAMNAQIRSRNDSIAKLKREAAALEKLVADLRQAMRTCRRPAARHSRKCAAGSHGPCQASLSRALAKPAAAASSGTA